MRLILLTTLALWGLAWAGNATEDAEADIDAHAKAAYFVYSGYVFALNVVENGDVYYHMHAPAQHSWFGIGFGSSMKNSRMLVSYLAADGHNLTNSCRMAYGHSEPEYDPDCHVDNVYSDKYGPFSNQVSPDGVAIAHAICRGCASWMGGKMKIDTKNTQQPFIYALGPKETLRSDDPNAPLRVHSDYGSFTLDMTVATNYTGDYGRVPAPQDPGLAVGDSFWAFANYFSSLPYNLGTLADWAPIAHAVFMCLAFILILPLGAISLRLVRRALFHGAVQMIGLAFVLIGFAFGVYASKLYNKSKHFNSAHQVIGLFILAGLFVQAGLGLSHHLMFMRSGVPTIMGKIHRFLGISILVLAIVNGGLGLNFSKSSVVAYTIVVAIMAVVMGSLATLVLLYNRKHVYRPEKEAFVSSGYGSDPPGEFEMHNAPFATMGHVQTPRTPFFRNQDQIYQDDPDNYRAHLMRSNTQRTVGQDSMYTDTPMSDKGDPFKGKWEAVPLR